MITSKDLAVRHWDLHKDLKWRSLNLKETIQPHQIDFSLKMRTKTNKYTMDQIQFQWHFQLSRRNSKMKWVVPSLTKYILKKKSKSSRMSLPSVSISHAWVHIPFSITEAFNPCHKLSLVSVCSVWQEILTTIVTKPPSFSLAMIKMVICESITESSVPLLCLQILSWLIY